MLIDDVIKNLNCKIFKETGILLYALPSGGKVHINMHFYSINGQKVVIDTLRVGTHSNLMSYLHHEACDDICVFSESYTKSSFYKGHVQYTYVICLKILKDCGFIDFRKPFDTLDDQIKDLIDFLRRKMKYSYKSKYSTQEHFYLKLRKFLK